MKKIKTFYLNFIVLTLVFIQNSFSQTEIKDTVYFDKHWKVTTKDQHAFYRPLPLKKIKNLSLIIDFHKNGNMQMQGYAYTDSLKVFVGDVYWYNKDGFDTSHEQNFNLTNLPLKYYHHNGTLWKTIIYKNGVKNGYIDLFNNKGNLILSENYNNGFTSNNTIGSFERRYYSGKSSLKPKRPYSTSFFKKTYWMNSGNIAKTVDYANKKITEVRLYNQSSKLIQKLYKRDFIDDKQINGKHYKYKTKNGFVTELDSVNGNSQTSKIIHLSNINLIGADKNGTLEFYQKKGTDEYLEIKHNLLHDPSTPLKSFWSYRNVNRSYSLETVTKYSDQIIKVSDIKSQTVESLLKSISKKEWSNDYSEPKSYSKDSVKHKVIFNQFNSDFFVHLDLNFKKVNHGGFGSSYTNKDDDLKKWRVENANFYTINVLLINNEKPILMLSYEDEIAYYIIPTKKGLTVNFNKENNATENINSKLNNDILKQLIQYSNATIFYGITSQNGKKHITNSFNEIVINKPYDYIERNNAYIICRNKNDIDIYNTRLEKLPIPNIRQVYYDRGNLQILSNNDVSFIDVLGNNTEKQQILYLFCGTVSYTDFNIVTEKATSKKLVNAIKITSGEFGHEPMKNNILLLENLDHKYDITFLNKTKSEGYDGNSSFVDGYQNRTNLLVAKRRKKVGLFSYSHDVKFNYLDKETPKDDALLIPEIIDINAPKYGKTKAKELLPVQYDEIELREPLIIVKKDDKYGIYSFKTVLKYKTLGKVNTNFMSYETLTGEKGWIDVRTLKEYPNK